MKRTLFRPLVAAYFIGFVGLNYCLAEDPSGGGNPGVMKIRTYGDDRPIVVEEELATLLSANANLAGSVKPQPLSFSAALARVHDLAHMAGAPGVLEPALKALPDNAPTTLRLLAVRELARKQPTAVFLLLLAAYDHDPASVDALADLAGVVAGLGYANEALAFLDELKRRNAVPSPPMDISGEDLVTYLRGYCLVRLGQVAAARPLLKAVADHQPMLAEAPRLLAIISEDKAEQRKYFLLGVWRHRSALMVCEGVDMSKAEPDPLVAGEQVAIDLRSLLDLSKGERGRLPDITYARSAMHANGLIPILEAKVASLESEMNANSEKRVPPKGFRLTDDSVNETRGHRMLTLMQSLDRRDQKLRTIERSRHEAVESTAKGLRQLYDETNKLSGDAVDALSRRIKRSPTPAEIGAVIQPFYDRAAQRARAIVEPEEKALRDRYAEWRLLASAIPAQVGDAAWWEHLRLLVEYERLYCYRQLLHLCASQARAAEHPFITKEPGEDPPPAAAQAIGKCDGSKSVSFSTGELPGSQALPFEFGVEMTCEGMSVEVDIDTRVPGISVSTELGVTNEGDFTAFVGPKASVNIGDKEIAAFGGSAKGGAYITGNRDGVKDAGVKYEVKVGGKIGMVSGSQKIAEGAVSFIPAPVTGDGGIEPLLINGR